MARKMKLSRENSEQENSTRKKSNTEITWSGNTQSAIVIAIEHPVEKPELDWWKDGYRGGTTGNRMLMSINAKLAKWLEEEKRIKPNQLPYYIEHSGIFLKDAAVMAGLGSIGKNNMLVTPEYGPRVRLRAMFTDEILPSNGPIDFDPCEECPMPCNKICPQQAFGSKIYSEKELGLEKLPARTGVYSRHLCNVQMEFDADNCEQMKSDEQDAPGRLVKYCRECELACLVGKSD
ncbi:epoxyqueuosine reductase [Thermodesulfobacteriota bacterium]